MTADAPASYACVDESEPQKDLDPVVYLLAAAILPAEALDESRAIMNAQRQRGSRKAHWHETRSNGARLALAEAAAATGAHVLVVVKSADPSATSERRRRLGLERLCFELQDRGVGYVSFESRGPADDRRDRALVDALRARRVLSRRLDVRHLAGPCEPLLWIADVACGVVNADRVGDAAFAGLFGDRLTVIEC